MSPAYYDSNYLLKLQINEAAQSTALGPSPPHTPRSEGTPHTLQIADNSLPIQTPNTHPPRLHSHHIQLESPQRRRALAS